MVRSMPEEAELTIGLFVEPSDLIKRFCGAGEVAQRAKHLLRSETLDTWMVVAVMTIISALLQEMKGRARGIPGS